MRVLEVLGYADRGGAAMSVLELARGLRDQNIDVTVASPLGSGFLGPALAEAEIPWVEVPLRGRTDAASFRKLRHVMRDRKIDVVHTHCRNADLIGGVAASSVRVPVVSHLRGLFRDAGGETVSTWVDRVHRQMLRRIPRLRLAISHTVRQRAAAWLGLPLSEIQVVRHGIEPTRLQPTRTRDEVRTAYGINPDWFWMVSVGSLGRCKAQDVLIEAASLLPRALPWRLTIFGDGDAELYRDMAREFHVSDRVIFAGSTDRIADVLSAADLVVHPSRWEGFGRVVAEAMAIGCPVVASDVDGIREIVDSGVHGTLVPPERPSELAYALQSSMTDLRTTRLRSTAGQKRALTEFTAERSSREIATHLRSAVGAPTSVSPEEMSL